MGASTAGRCLRPGSIVTPVGRIYTPWNQPLCLRQRVESGPRVAALNQNIQFSKNPIKSNVHVRSASAPQ